MPGSSGEEGIGNFFAIDRGSWEMLWQRGGSMNIAVAYLVLARFSDRTQRRTNAGVQAVETYTNISRSRAGVAIRRLEELGMVTPATGRSSREIIFADNRDPDTLTPSRRRAYEAAKAGEQPSSRSEKVATTYLTRAGWLAPRADGQLAVTSPERDWIWLPNALVTGAASETPPVELVRGSGDPRSLRILVDLYHAQNLREDGGVRWHGGVYRKFERFHVGQQGEFTIWGFVGRNLHAWADAPFIAPHLRCYNGTQDRDEKWQSFWSSLEVLQHTGLVEFVPHLVESMSSEAEVIHPFAVGGRGEPIERQLCAAAHALGRAMVTESQYKRAATKLQADPWLAPVPSHRQSVQMVGIPRLRYRPRTKATSAWYGNLLSEAGEYLERYRQRLKDLGVEDAA